MGNISKIIILIFSLIALFFAIQWFTTNNATYEPKVTLIASIVAVLSYFYDFFKKSNDKIEPDRNIITSTITGNNNKAIVGTNQKINLNYNDSFTFLNQKVKELREAKDKINEEFELPDIAKMYTNPQEFLDETSVKVPFTYVLVCKVFHKYSIHLDDDVATVLEKEHLMIEDKIKEHRIMGVNENTEGIFELMFDLLFSEISWIKKVNEAFNAQLTIDLKKLKKISASE